MYGLSAKQISIEMLIFPMSGKQRVAIEKIVSDLSRARTSMLLTQIIARAGQNQDIVMAILPLLKQDCIDAVKAQHAA